jgi:hypothetical protein
MKRALVLALGLVLASWLVACGSDSKSGGNTATPDPDEGKSFSAELKADQGGTLATDSGNAKVEVPANALKEDITLTVAVQAATADTAASVYEFGPDGTEFQVPVTVSIKFDGSAPDGKHVVLATLAGTTWEEIPNSKLEAGVVSGQTKHFSKFSLIIVDDEVVLVSECSEVAQDFQPCGGDVEGTWKFKQLCSDTTALGQDPFGGSCPDASVDMDITVDGTVTFTAGGEMQMSGMTMNMAITYNIPNSCIPANAQCVGLFGTDAEDPVCAESGSKCVCEKTSTNTGEPETMSYTVEGNNLVTTNSDGEVDTVPFCQQGNTVTVKITEEGNDPEDPDVVMYYVVEKQ